MVADASCGASGEWRGAHRGLAWRTNPDCQLRSSASMLRLRKGNTQNQITLKTIRMSILGRLNRRFLGSDSHESQRGASESRSFGTSCSFRSSEVLPYESAPRRTFPRHVHGRLSPSTVSSSVAAMATMFSRVPSPVRARAAPRRAVRPGASSSRFSRFPPPLRSPGPPRSPPRACPRSRPSWPTGCGPIWRRARPAPWTGTRSTARY